MFDDEFVFYGTIKNGLCVKIKSNDDSYIHIELLFIAVKAVPI